MMPHNCEPGSGEIEEVEEEFQEEDFDGIGAAEYAEDEFSIEEMEEEHGGEEGLLSEAKNDKDKINKQSVQKRLKDIQFEPESDDERAIPNQYPATVDKKAPAGKTVRDAPPTPHPQALKKYPTHTQ